MTRTSIGSQTITVIPLATGSGGIAYKDFVLRSVTSPAQSGYVELTVGTTYTGGLPFDAQFSHTKFASGGSTIDSQNTRLGFAGGETFGFSGFEFFHLSGNNSAEQNFNALISEINSGENATGTTNSTWAWDSTSKPGALNTLEIRDPYLLETESLSFVTGGGFSGWGIANIPADAGGVVSVQPVLGQEFDRGDIVRFDDNYFIYDGDNRLITDAATEFPVDGEVWEQISDSTDRFIHAFNNWNGRIAYKKDNIVTYDGLFIRVTEQPEWVSGQYYSFGNTVAYEGVLFERNITSLTLDPEITPTADPHWIAFTEDMPSIENTNWNTFLTSLLGDARYQGALTAGVNISIDPLTDTISVPGVYTKDEVDGIVNSWADYAIGGVYVSQSRNLSDNGLIITLDYAGGQVFREILDDGSLDRIYNTNTDGVLTDLLKTRGG